jgi:hypothetical protein
MHRAILLAAGLVLSLAAQTDRATLTGTVLDPSQKVAPGAKVTVHAVETGLVVVTIANSAGAYTISALPVGQYTATIAMPGFTTVNVEPFSLEVGQTRTLNATLSISAVVAKTTVEASAAGLDASSAEIGGVIRRSQIKEIPLNGRDWSSLMSLAPGAIDSSTGVEQGVRFAGLSQEDNNFHFDGVDATGINHSFQQSNLYLQISTEAIDEFRVNSTTYSADQGFTPGGQVEIVSRTGTNAFHGSAYEFVRNKIFNARPFNAATPPAFHWNNYGASFGGPVLKNKLFFFVNYEGLRQLLNQPLTALVPADAYRAQVIQKSPVLAPIVNAFPEGTAPSSDPNVRQFFSSGRQIVNEDSGLFRVDYLFNEKTTAFVRFSTDHSTQDAPNGQFGEHSTTIQNMPNGIIDVQHSFSPNLLNDAKIAFNRSENISTPYPLLPFGVSVNGLSSFSSSTGGTVEVLTSYSIVDNATFVKGPYTIKGGVEIRRIQSNKSSNHQETYSYNSLTDFMNNFMNSDTVSLAGPENGVRKMDYFGYLLDEVKVRPNLTLNLGLRYEFFGVPYEQYHRGRAFDPLSCPNQFCAPTDAWYFPNMHDFAPRVSAAWSPKMFHGKTVIRSGWGIYWGEGQLGPLAGAYKNDVGIYTLTQVTSPGLSYPVTSFIGSAVTSVTPNALDRHRKDLAVSQWSFSIQNEIAPKTTLQVGYFGNEGAHLIQKINLNGVDPATGKRPYAGYATIQYYTTNAVGNFNALQASLQRSVSTGLLISANYQWSHAIDDGSLGGGEFIAQQNTNCRSCDRSSSSQDMREYFAASSIWKIPVGRGHAVLKDASPFWNSLLGGWQLSGIGTARTGLPLNVTISRPASALPDQINGGQRPDCVAGVSLYPAHQTVQQWLNPAVFVMPAAGTWGNCGRNLVRAPGIWQVDTALQKRMPLTERIALSFRAEAFNVFNRAQYGNPAASLPSGNFGLITSAFNSAPIGTGTPRELQFMLRLDY